MKTTHTLYTKVQPFYTDLVDAIATAENQITMMYFTFDAGEWSEKIARILSNKASSGVQVRLMVDELGLALDDIRHARKNWQVVADLRASGIQVDIFRPRGNRLTQGNRLHTKICAIDTHTAFIGGSNIGDHYLGWDDNNLRITGEL